MARNIIECRTIGKLENQDYVNVVHFADDTNLVPDVDPTPLLVALAEAYILCWVQHMLPVLTPSFVLEKVTAKMISPEVGDEVEVSTGAGPGQASSVDGLPSFCSVKVEKKTGGGGRSGRGRMYLPPLPESRTTNSILDADGKTAIQAFLACIIGKFVGASKTTQFEIGVLSRKPIINPLSGLDVNFRGCTQIVLSDHLAIMGRRKVGSGS